MTPKPQSRDAFHLFQAHFDQILNPQHELIQLAKKIDWPRFDAAFAGSYSQDMGAPAKAIRLMVGLQYLKYTFNESDESTVAHWVENPYWQYFCGYTYMQHRCPIHPTSMTKWRNRVGADRLAELLKETISLALREKQLSARDLQRVNVDTTVQEKNVTYPTDSKLLYKVIIKLGKAAKSRGIGLRQSFIRVAKNASVMASRYAHARQYQRMRKQLRRLRTYAGRLIRDIQRQASMMDEDLATLLSRADRIRQQRPQDSHKVYSLHELEVQCISKGKAHKRYEFGQKIALAMTNDHNWILASLLLPDNPYDGHTLTATMTSAESNTGIAITDAYVDKGYRGHDYTGSAQIHVAGQRYQGYSRSERRRRRRRSAIEPKIGHLKSDHRMDRCFLAGLRGDAINAVLAAAGANLRKLLRRFFFALIRWLRDVAFWLPCPKSTFIYAT